MGSQYIQHLKKRRVPYYISIAILTAFLVGGISWYPLKSFKLIIAGLLRAVGFGSENFLVFNIVMLCFVALSIGTFYIGVGSRILRVGQSVERTRKSQRVSRVSNTQ